MRDRHPHRFGWRWSVVLALVAGLVTLPAGLQAIPVGDRPAFTAASVVAAVTASSGVAHHGTAESRGRLDLPDVRRLGDVIALFGGTTRTRVWYSGSEAWRVDEQGVAGDVATYRDPAGTWTWDSAEGTAVRVAGETARLPQPVDLGPAVLGRRLVAAAGGSEVTRIGAARIAGRTGLGIRIVPRDRRTLVRDVTVWADEDTGLPLRVAVTAVGAEAPVLESWWLDVRLEPPDPAVVDFVLPTFVPATSSDAPDLVALVNRFAPYDLPAVLAGLARDPGSAAAGPRGAGMYGAAFTRLLVLPLPRDIARPTFGSLAGAAPVRDLDVRGHDALALDTPLLSALALRAGDRAYLLVGTVTPAVLEDAASDLVLQPPPRQEPSR